MPDFGVTEKLNMQVSLIMDKDLITFSSLRMAEIIRVKKTNLQLGFDGFLKASVAGDL